MTNLPQAILDIAPEGGRDAIAPSGYADYASGYADGHRDAREAAANLAASHHADVLRLRHAALWLASNAPGTPVPEWVDAAVNDPAVMASGDAAELVGDGLPGVERENRE